MSLANQLHMLNEALSRARMRQPQDVHHSEAHRSARQIAMRARRAQNDWLGH